ncbi:hypothetical protein Nepgr_006469 [Nepenthes gracilis]|uniref:HMA domain-containing protein n=1 Tax=Nepenthes gracilis TaxID=150966 RepID=A0AAD3S5E1_NEPGR|nr:hypothetical protein Nepgr_006469 [Nepenthes gracilis]
MGRLSFGRVLDCLCLSSGSCSCFCISSLETQEDEAQSMPLVENGGGILSSKDFVSGHQTLAFHLEPKTVVLKVSMHCNCCARKVEKHVSKIEGVTSYKVDLETKMVVVIGDILPFEVLESVSKVKTAQFWASGM